MPVYNHIGLVVSDLERSKRFYEHVLGFRVWYEDLGAGCGHGEAARADAPARGAEPAT